MNSKRMIFGVCLIAVISQSGCSLIPTCIGGAKAQNKYLNASSVSVTPWLANPTSIFLANESLSLPEILQTPKIASQRAMTAVVAKTLEDADNLFTPNFKDNCVVLVRGNDHWYFLEPSSLLEFYAGRIRLRPGDKVYTLPFRMSKFVVPRLEGEYGYVLLELGQSPRRITVDGKKRDANMSSLLIEEAPPTWWTMTVVTRIEGGALHHLVLPAPFGSSSPLDAPLMSPIRNEISNVTFQPGDIVEKTNFTQFVSRF